MYEPYQKDAQGLFPAHAGVILVLNEHFTKEAAFPRTRGGDPYCPNCGARMEGFSPHTRG